MRFAHSFTFGARSRSAKRRLASHQRIGAQSGVPCDQPLSGVFSPCAILLEPIAPSTQGQRNLTEFPFAANFSKPDLERV
jgi:hypothetical protein